MPTPIVIDSDTFNEIDDQFAIAYALCRPKQVRVLAMLAAPFYNEKSSSPEDGMLKSLAEMERLRTLCHSDVPIFAGSKTYLAQDASPVESPAVDELIRLAHSMPDGKPLHVVAIAALTNIASALLKAPELRQKLVIYWLGANAVDFHDQNEFNLRQDRLAAQTVFNSGVPMVWFPCRGVCTHLTTTLWELEHWLKGKNPLADALHNLFVQSGAVGIGQSRVLWDVAPIAALCNPRCVAMRKVPSPIVLQGAITLPADRPAVDYVHMIDRDQVLSDFFAAIGDFSAE